MKQGRFDERLDEIIVRAAMRLQERMRLAYFRGNLTGYLERIGLAGEIDPERQSSWRQRFGRRAARDI